MTPESHDESAPNGGGKNASDLSRDLMSEAGVFMGLAFTSFSVQLALIIAKLGPGGLARLWRPELVVVVLGSDFLTGVFSLATMARIDLAYHLREKDGQWSELGTSGSFSRSWFVLERSFLARVEPGREEGYVVRKLGRGLAGISSYRQLVTFSTTIAILGVTAAFLLLQ